MGLFGSKPKTQPIVEAPDEEGLERTRRRRIAVERQRSGYASTQTSSGQREQMG